MSLEEALRAVDPDWIAARAAEMVAIPSVTMDERSACDDFARALAALGLTPIEREVTPGRRNIYARLAGTGGGPALALNGHLDTIRIGGAWPMRREGDRLYGRGAEDMKGPLAAALGALRAVLTSGLRLAGDLWITAVVGHEAAAAGKDGARAFVDDVNAGLLPAERIVIVKGDEALWMMSMGSAVFAITLESDSGGAHTDGVPFGHNPIRHVGRLIEAFAALQERLDAGARHPLAGAERIDVGIVRGGDYYNRTPGACYLEGTRRWAPGSTVADIRAELEEIIGRVATEGGLRWRLKLMMDREPFEVAADDPCLRAFAVAAQRVNGTAPALVGRRIVGDASIYVHGCGRPTFYYGPGYRTAHADVEWVSVEALARTARVYVAGAAGYCGLAGGR